MTSWNPALTLMYFVFHPLWMQKVHKHQTEITAPTLKDSDSMNTTPSFTKYMMPFLYSSSPSNYDINGSTRRLSHISVTQFETHSGKYGASCCEPGRWGLIVNMWHSQYLSTLAARYWEQLSPSKFQSDVRMLIPSVPPLWGMHPMSAQSRRESAFSS